MGKVEMKGKKKKGRPSKNLIPLSTPPKPINYDSTQTPTTNRRSIRRNPNSFNSPEFDDEDDDERKEKKVKLVVRLPQSDENHKINQKHPRDYDYASGSASDSENREAYAKKLKNNAVDRGSEDVVTIQERKVVKETETPIHGSPLESGPTIPLPDKKLLVFILDRLQKKDTYGVFSEPVDPSELPDYFEIIEQPMDFGTLRKKLDGGAYKNLDELEADVFLICSNAMLYNAPDTVYYRQARSIQEIAKRDFANLKHEGYDGEPQPKVVRRGRPPSNKNLKRQQSVETVGRPELSSGATLASTEPTECANSYNLRKGPALYRFRPNDPFVSSSYRSRNGENYSEWMADWNDEFPASILRADMKYGKKHFTVDENRRDTYRKFHPISSRNKSLLLSNSIGDVKLLVPVGLQEPLAYARSIARYVANLGAVAWNLASKKIDSVLPPGVQYGPGWVGEDGMSFSTEKQKSSNSTSDLSSAIAAAAYGPSEGIVEAVRKLNSQNDAANSWIKQFPSIQQKPDYQSQGNINNGFSGLFGYPIAQGKVSGEAEMLSFGKSESWQTIAMQQQRQHNILFPPDLNVRIPAGSPGSSSLQIGSPQQPDLALQL